MTFRRTVFMKSTCLLWGTVLSLLTAFPLQGGERTLTFPARAVGVVTVSDPPRDDGQTVIFSDVPHEVRPAGGLVSVSETGFVGLRLPGVAELNLSFLSELEPDVLHSIYISGAKLGSQQLQQIASVQSLVQLKLRSCEFSTTAFEELKALANLVDLSITHRNASEYDNAAMAAWIGKLPELRQLYTQPALRTAAYQLIGGHSTLTTINADLGDDADQMLLSLSALPSLQVLTVSVADEVDVQDLKGINSLSELDSLRWFGRHVDGDVARCMAGNKNLSRLAVYNVAVKTSFIEELASLTHLTELEIVATGDSQPNGNVLAKALFRLSDLRNWPILRNVDAKTLQQIVTNPQIESLVLDGVAQDVTPELLRGIGHLKTLKRLDIRGVPVDDQWLGCLTDLQDLEYLNLFATAVTGSGFSALSDLPDLREIHLNYSYVDEVRVQPDLASLCRLRALESLQIGGSYTPEQAAELSGCDALRDLRLWDFGYADDSTAIWLSKHRPLRKLTLDGDCILTDVGARALARHTGLQTVHVGGAITERGAMELAAMPSLCQLSISSSEMSENSVAAIRDSAPTLPELLIRPFSGAIIRGEDGLLRKRLRGQGIELNGKDGILRTSRRGDSSLRSLMDELEGKPAPRVGGQTADGQRFDWEGYRGKVVLIDFWGTWCGPCRAQQVELRELHAKYHDQGFEIVGVHTRTGADALPEYLKRNPLPWPNILDTKDEIGTSYLVPHYPSVFLIDRKGVLRVAFAYHLGLDDAIRVLLRE